MKTAIENLRELWAAGEYRKAVKLAASWPRLGEHKTAIQQGWAACTNPDFYRQIGKDPDALYTAALLALVARYELTEFCGCCHADGPIEIHACLICKGN